jgi:hypothetical protein
MGSDPYNKVVAKAIARNTSIDPEKRLALARKFDPGLKSLNEGTFDDFKRYEE